MSVFGSMDYSSKEMRLHEWAIMPADELVNTYSPWDINDDIIPFLRSDDQKLDYTIFKLLNYLNFSSDHKESVWSFPVAIVEKFALDWLLEKRVLPENIAEYEDHAYWFQKNVNYYVCTHRFVYMLLEKFGLKKWKDTSFLDKSRQDLYSDLQEN